MIRRHPPRPWRGPYQDFHFFAAGDPIANLASRPPARAVLTPAVPAVPSVAPAPPAAPTPSGAPCTIDSVVPSEKAAALGAVEAPEKTDAADALPPLERPAVRVLQDTRASKTSPSKARAGKPRPSARKPREVPKTPRVLGYKRARAGARLATPRRAKSRKARLPLASQPRASHETQCTLCAHPDRVDIENEFIHWHSLNQISRHHKISRSAIYRHAYALGLFSERNRRLRFALGHLIERVQYVEPTADAIVRAVHLFARINDEGQCVEPPAHVIVSSGAARREVSAPNGRRPIAISLDSSALALPASPEPPMPTQEDAPKVADDAPPAPKWLPGAPNAHLAIAAQRADSLSASQPCNSLKTLPGANARAERPGACETHQLRPAVYEVGASAPAASAQDQPGFSP